MKLLETILNDPKSIASIIEHTNVSVNSREKDIVKLCKEVLKYKFYAAVTLPYYSKLVSKLLKGRAKVVTVIGFPYGVQTTDAKVTEVKSVLDYVDEFDMIMNRTAFSNKDYRYVVNDIKAVVKAAGKKIVKVIIETPELSYKEIKIASRLVAESGAHFVKTAVGYSGPAKVEHVKIMKSVVKDKVKIKASGGIKNFNQALEMIKAGADRIGTSRGVDIIKSIPKK